MADAEPDLADAPMGGTLVPGGATFRIWAPRANAVYVSGDFNGWKQDGGSSLRQIGGGHWASFSRLFPSPTACCVIRTAFRGMRHASCRRRSAI